MQTATKRCAPTLAALAQAHLADGGRRHGLEIKLCDLGLPVRAKLGHQHLNRRQRGQAREGHDARANASRFARHAAPRAAAQDRTTAAHSRPSPAPIGGAALHPPLPAHAPRQPGTAGGSSRRRTIQRRCRHSVQLGSECLGSSCRCVLWGMDLLSGRSRSFTAAQPWRSATSALSSRGNAAGHCSAAGFQPAAAARSHPGCSASGPA